MQNLNQIRARHVLEFAECFGKVSGSNGGEVIKKIPPVMMNNGLLSALAYAMDERNKSWRNVFDGIASHLASQEIAIVPGKYAHAEALLGYLTSDQVSCNVLRVATAEAEAWLDFARRLVR